MSRTDAPPAAAAAPRTGTGAPGAADNGTIAPPPGLPAPLATAFAGLGSEATADRLVADLDALVSVDTTYPPGASYPAITDWLATRLAPLGFACRRVEVPRRLWDVPGLGAEGARVNLVASRDTGRPPLSIYAHLDVVPAGSGWTRPPFRATREGGRVYGRGASDMKGTIAALLAALDAAAAHGIALRYDPRLLFCTDEEGGAYPGIRWLAEQGEVTGHLLCMDGSAAPRLWAGSFGSIDLRITVQGRAGHSGQRGSGENALEKAIPILNALMALKAKVEARQSALPPPPRDAGRPLSALLSITVMQAGTKANVVPERCAITVNRRTMPEEDDAAAIAEIEAAVAEGAAQPGARVETVVQGHLAPVLDADQGPHWPRWIAAASAAWGWRPEEYVRFGSSGSSDMGWVQRLGQREILMGGLSRPENAIHAPDESAALADMVALGRAILLYMGNEFAPGT